jgi:chemotaxis protein methyltransferase CheR
MVTTEQFDRTRRLALRMAGIELAPRHRELLDLRSRGLGGAAGIGFDDLLRAAETGNPKARRTLLGLLTTKFTGFFRHPWHFDLAAEQALWAAQRRGRARLWSAAAATGEEPYSLAMALIEVFRREDPPAAILATDVDADALETARRGEYGEAALGAVAPERRDRFGTEIGSGRWRLGAAARSLIEFRNLNLAAPVWRIEGSLDVILCRNVLIYLDETHRRRVLERMASLLPAGGLLILDPAERIGPAGLFRRTTTPGVFLREAGQPGRPQEG